MYELTSHTKPYHTKPYHISSLYLQLSTTAILIHNATLPFSEDRDCKPFLACFKLINDKAPLALPMEPKIFALFQTKVTVYIQLLK